MSKTALYRKYRSRSLQDLVGQEHITTTLSNALTKDSISHAYLFTGPHGVGKTSTARIMAYAINDIDYDEAAPLPIDIIEIDAASNRRIDEIRDLRETIHIAPTELRYKVYIIDEVHMLTKEAFNALLKTLEEPPAHAIFILATTEAHKLPSTIISRTQQFVFRPVQREYMVKHLAYIASEEQIPIDPGALEILAQHSGGSFRDAISMLDQVSQTDKEHITPEHIQHMLGVIDDHALSVIDESIHAQNIQVLSTTLRELFNSGKTATRIALQYAEFLRNQLAESNNTSNRLHTIETIKKLLSISRSSDPELQLEIVLIGSSLLPEFDKKVQKPTKSHVPPKAKTQPSSETTKSSKTRKEKEDSTTKPPVPVQKIELTQSEDWDDILAYTKENATPLYAVLRQCIPAVDEKQVHIQFKYALHHRKASRSNYQELLAKIVGKVYGDREFKMSHNPTAQAQPPAIEKTIESQDKSENTDTISEISSLLGGEIVNLK